MKYKTLTQIEKRVEKIKQELKSIQQMRPGSLTRQYHNPKDKTGAYYQLSYTHKMKSRTEYVRPEYVEQLSKQISEYKRFKELVEEWIELAIQHSKMQIDRAKKDK
jgi:ribosomal protein L29